MSQKVLKVYAMRVDEEEIYKGRVEHMTDTLGELQKFVGGSIQIVSLTGDLALVINEEGKIDGLPYNRVWLFEDGQVADILVGNVFVCRYGEGGNFTSILDEDIPAIQKMLPALKNIEGKVIHCIREWRLPDYDKKS